MAKPDVSALAQKMVIYLLRCPLTGAVRYIGKANDVSRRLHEHIARAGAGTWCSSWVKVLLSNGQKPEIEVLFPVQQSVIAWQIAERFFIASARYFEFPITNSTIGGEGVNANPEVEGRRRASIRAAHARPDVKARHADAIRRACARPLVKLRQSIKQKEVGARPEVRARRSKQMTIKMADASARAKLSADMTLVWAARNFVSHLHREDPDQAVDFVHSFVAGLGGEAHARP